METATKREWRPLMGEISGFGGGYEAGCRAMLFAGLDWLDQHPNADPQYHGFKGVYGLIDTDNDDARALDAAVIAACDGCSGAMHHAVISHIMFIRAHSWDEYCAEMSKRDKGDHND